MLLAIDGRTHPTRFWAGVVLENDTVTEAAPILRWMIGKSLKFVGDYSARQGWPVYLAGKAS